MTSNTQLSSQIYIKVNGRLAEDDVMANLIEVTVEQHAHLPDMFAIRLHDAGLNFIDGGPFDLTQPVEIGAFGPDEEPLPLISGEITALEPNFNASMVAELVVRGYDRSHRLYRVQKSRAFLNVKDSDLAQTIAANANLDAEVAATTVIYDHVYQDNQSDLTFLMERAWRIGYECFLEGETLYFRPPPADAAAQTTLAWGEDNLAVRPFMTLAEQVDEVLVKGWDAEKQEPIVGQAQNGRLYPDIDEERDGAEWAAAFGRGQMVITDQPVVSQREADLLAEARLNERSGAFITVHGSVFRRPDVKAGQMIRLEGLGKRFSGRYLVTEARHVYDPQTGLETDFTVRGLRAGLLSELVDDAEPRRRWPGVVTAVVTNTDDPKGWGRVKVKFPWLADDVESDWARLALPDAGGGGGMAAAPAVGDEVLVAFAHGDFSRPFVLGGLWNGRSPAPPEVTDAQRGAHSQVRAWRSRNGHRVTMRDDLERGVTVETAAGHRLTLDDSGDQITLSSRDGLTIRLDNRKRRITIEGDGDVNVAANGNMNLRARGNMNLAADGQVNVKGAMINLN